MRAVIAIALLCLGCNKPNQAVPIAAGDASQPRDGDKWAKTPLLNQVPPRPEIAEKAEIILAGYRLNELAGDNAFKGKRIRMQGIIQAISKVKDRPVISVGNRAKQVHCFFPANLDQAHIAEMATLRRGDLINMDGTCRGDTPTGVVFTECSWPSVDRVRSETPELLKR